jgi:hypothetical protein
MTWTILEPLDCGFWHGCWCIYDYMYVDVVVNSCKYSVQNYKASSNAQLFAMLPLDESRKEWIY